MMYYNCGKFHHEALGGGGGGIKKTLRPQALTVVTAPSQVFKG